MRLKANKIFRVLLVAVLNTALAVAPAHAQSLGTLLGNAIHDAAATSQMKKVCLDNNFATVYAGRMMGYHILDTGGGDRVSTEKDNALAEEIISRATITQWAFKGWQGNEISGRCSMYFAMKLAPQDAAHFNNDPDWGGDVTLTLNKQDGSWKLVGLADEGATSAVSGWLAAWMRERDNQPGGAARQARALSPQELQSKVRSAQSCSTDWAVSDDLFPAYNAWIDALDDTGLQTFKVSDGARLANGRLVSTDDTSIVCRYDISTGTMGGLNADRAIHDLDMRFTVVGNRPNWAVVSYPSVPLKSYPVAQIKQLFSQVYINGEPFPQWSAERSGKPAPAKPKNVLDGLNQAQAQANAEMEDIARSEGLPVDEIKKAEAEETRKYAEPCRMSGGTWGRPQDKYGNLGRLGCYHPTGER